MMLTDFVWSSDFITMDGISWNHLDDFSRQINSPLKFHNNAGQKEKKKLEMFSWTRANCVLNVGIGFTKWITET